MNEVLSVVVVQHVACESLGTIEPVLQSLGIRPRFIRVHEGQSIPARLEDASGLIVLGGPMSVYESGSRLHLREEMRLISSALAADRPVLGVCLGSQLLAHVLGEKVFPGTRKEIGWHRVKLSPAAHEDPLWNGVAAEFQAFHWHGDVYELPRNAVALASSDLTACQAFRSGTSVYGILFHLEVTEPLIDGMAASFAEELTQSGGSPQQLREGAQKHLESLTKIGQSVFAGWARLVNPIDK